VIHYTMFTRFFITPCSRGSSLHHVHAVIHYTMFMQ
jgi:hypothetical protein